jgi:hypothetical protein
LDWTKIIGLGLAGNFTGHLEQAGEDSDFKKVQTTKTNAPKGIFPFYVPTNEPKSNHYLHEMPISPDHIRLNSLHENHQIEPEMSLLCDLSYQNNQVTSIRPRFAMAHNDCSIRREGALKISEKKNWGTESKGSAVQKIEIDRFAPGGVLDNYRLTSFLVRKGVLHDYGVDSPVSAYSYFYQELLDWLVDRMNHQEDHGPLENIAAWLKIAGYPNQALISVGATRYTNFGAQNFLQPGDRSIVVLYDPEKYDLSELRKRAQDTKPPKEAGLSILNQSVYI